MDEKLVQMWIDESGESYDGDYEADKLQNESLYELIDSAITAFYANRNTWNEVDEFVLETVVDRNSFAEPIKRSHYEFIRDESSIHFGVGHYSKQSTSEMLNVPGREVIFEAYYHPELKKVNTWTAVVWDDEYFDEVVSVPEDLKAVDLHDAYQFGEHYEYGQNYVICGYGGDVVRIEW